MLGLFVAAVLIFTLRWLQGQDIEEATPPLLQVEVTQILPQPVPRQVEISGFLRPWRSVNLAMDETGRVASLEREHGDLVAAGDLIAVLDTSLMEAEVSEMRAALDQAREERDLATSRLERSRALFAEQSTSQDRLDARIADASVANATVRLREALLEREQVRRERHHLRAPMPGTLEELALERGSHVQAGEVLGRLDDTATLEVVLQVAPEVRESLHLGDEVALWPDTDPEEIRMGVIHRMAEVADSLTRKFEVEVRLDNSDHRLLGGAPMVSRLTTGPPRETLLLRQEWVVSRSGIDGVFRLVDPSDASARVEFVPVEVEPVWLSPGLVEVLRGLNSGDWLASERLAELKHEMPVTPLRSTATGG
jgi:RND family efflux transporter MFP subunit